MEERNPLAQPERLPGEVVETYRPRDAREVVETYVRPLPGLSHEEPEQEYWVEGPARKSRTGLWICLLLVLLATLLALGGWGVSLWQRSQEPSPRHEPRDAEITIPTAPWGEGGELQLLREPGETLTAQEVYRQVNPAVVMVLAQLSDGTSMGTGVIFSRDGYILTNYHVVEGGRDCMVVLDNNAGFPALYVAGDEENDLAVLKADLTDLPPMYSLPTAEFGNSDVLEVGETVYAIGNPLEVTLRGTFTNGIVSAIDRYVEVDGRIMNLIQTNAALNSGNSGGPLINESGQVVGINVIKMASRDDDTVEGLGFAIPSVTVGRLVNDLLTYGETQPEPRIGMSVLHDGEALGNGLFGVEVVEIAPGSAADKAGMQVGDFVTRVGDVDIAASRDVFWARRQYHVGDDMTVTVYRDGQQVELLLHLDEAFE